MKLPKPEEPLPVCGIPAHRKFRDRAGTLMTACVLEPDHDGLHVFCVKVREGIDDRAHALHYFEELTRTTLKPAVFVEMESKNLTTDEECAALFQFMELLKKKKRPGRGRP